MMKRSSSRPSSATSKAVEADNNMGRRVNYTIDPLQEWNPENASLFILVLCCLSGMFTDILNVPVMSIAFPGLFLSWICSIDERKNPYSTIFGLVLMSGCRGISGFDYFGDGKSLSPAVTYATCSVISFTLLSILLLASRVQKALWKTTEGNETATASWRSPLGFPIVLTGLNQLVFWYSPIGSTGNVAMGGFAFHPVMVQYVAWVGEIGLVFWVGWTACLFCGLLIDRIRRRHVTCYVVLNAVLMVMGGIRQLSGRGMWSQHLRDWPGAKAEAIDVSCLTRADDGRDMISRTNERLAVGDDLIVWSEMATRKVTPDMLQWPTTANNNAANAGSVVAVTFADSVTEGNATPFYNCLEFWQAGKVLYHYEKNNPVPVLEARTKAGETPPHSVDINLTPRQTHRISHVNNTDTVASDRQQRRDNITSAFSGAICFDFDFPDSIRKITPAADIVVGPSQYWASIGQLFWGHNIYRAVENGFTLIKCSADGISGAVDPFGRIIAARPTSWNRVFTMQVPVTPRVWTIYSSGGGYLFG